MSLAELRLVVTRSEARVTVTHEGKFVEDEVWRFPMPLARSEARQIAKVMFDDVYDALQNAVHPIDG